jgi:hypothetical protein
MGWLDYIGVCDTLSHGVGGVIFGENEACMSTVFRWEWSQDVKDLYQIVIGHGIVAGNISC